MIGLISDKNDEIKIRTDLMDSNFPSIWCEETRVNEKNLLICGFYREWCSEGVRSIKSQVESLRIFNTQLERSASENKNVVVQGDANFVLCLTFTLIDNISLSIFSFTKVLILKRLK